MVIAIKILNGLENHQFLGAYYIQFYNNGAVSFINYLEPNPEKSGNRGVFYIRNEKMFIDKFGLSLDRSGITYSYRLKVEGEIIFIYEDFRKYSFLNLQNRYVLFIKNLMKRFQKNGRNTLQTGK